MKDAIIVLSVMALIVSGCGQKADKQAATRADGVDSSVNNSESVIEMPGSGSGAGVDRRKDFDSTLVGHEEWYVEKDSVTASDWKNVSCKWLSFDNGYITREECVFPAANLQQVYDVVKKTDPNLKIELPGANLEYLCNSTNSGCKRVKYQYKSKKLLLIELAYEGGLTFMEIIEGGNSSQANITYSAD